MVIKIIRKFSRGLLATVIPVLILGVPSVRAQWTQIAPNLVQPESQHIGAIRFHAGVAWAGTNALYYSNDSGATWTQDVTFQPVWQDGTGISDIAIYDPLHILVSTINIMNGANGAGLYLTSDGGKTWTNIQPAGSDGNFVQAAYNGSANTLHALEYDESALFTSLDGGDTWNGTLTTNSNQSNGSLCFAIASDKTIYVESYNGSQGWINSSTDLGQTWSADSNPTDGDCNTLSADSCDDQRLYLINENVAQNRQSRDPQSHIDVTTNGGQNWVTTSSYSYDYYNGSLASTLDVLYVGTYTPTAPNYGSGVQRSMDSGLTWKKIGGPSEEYDTRSIAAVNDNILLVLDQGGNVWRTLNSGGNPVPPPFSASPAMVFQSDTVSCQSLTRSVVFNRRGCSEQSVMSVTIIGADSANYQAGNFNQDSVPVTLFGASIGAQQAKLVLTLDNGTQDTVSLAGYVSNSSSVLSLASENVQTDTLGGTVSVPITINGLEHPENIDLVLHYDGSVQYLGSYSPMGVRLDIPGDSSSGRSVLSITGAAPGVVLGHAKFNVFNDSNTVAHATFDSVDVLSATSICEYALPAPVTSTITPLSGCGISLLSKDIHLGQAPVFGISPNPAAGTAWITSSADLGPATISVYDMLGTRRSSFVSSVQQGTPFSLPLPDADGVYTIVIQSSAGVNSVRVVRER